MLSKTTKNRIGYKLDKLFWFIVSILPIIFYFAINYRNPAATGFFEYVSAFSPFSYIENIFNDITRLAFDTTFPLVSYLSYCVGVEIFHVFFDVIVFIPRLAHKWVGKAVQDD